MRGGSAPIENAPPNDLEAEQAVFGAMMLAPNVITEVSAAMAPADHYRPAHETIHQLILDLHGQGAAVDPITLGHRPKPPGLPNRVTAVAEETQVPPDLASTLALSVLAVAVGGCPVVHRKSAVFCTMTGPLYEAEKLLVAEAARSRNSRKPQATTGDLGLPTP
ncbi:DnaB-like helicase N-terminal domain-containing protein [Streptomyces chrestomyceticus]|uniref:DnaB-like helicase N-terminal domain-containing protein n=1 Tax=Streptomyces chrestomyceticus TaxID=68185 RepID=UPI0035A83611